jgi:hypothetical protein
MSSALPQSYANFCYLHSERRAAAPFDLLIDPSVFLTAELPGLSTGETQYIAAFDLNPVIASIAVDFIGYERRFNRDVLTLISILASDAPQPPELAQGLTCPLHELSIAHRPYLDKLEKAVRNHRPAWVSEFVSAFCHTEQIVPSHQRYILQFLAVEGFVNVFSANCTSEISEQLKGRLLIQFFKLPFSWQKTAASVASELTRNLKGATDRRISDLLFEFKRATRNLSASIDSIPKLEQVSRLFIREPFPIVDSGRRFIREGRALKQCRKAISERELLLFSDIFMYVQPKGGKYMVPARYQCEFLRIVPKSYNGASCLDVYAPRKSFILQFGNQDERDSWTLAFQEAIVNARATKRVPHYKEAPIWVPDACGTECKHCKAPMTFFRRKHHCRACGNIFCRGCLPKKIRLCHISETGLCQVCQACFDAIQREETERAIDEDADKAAQEVASAVAQESSSSTSSDSEEQPEGGQ